MLSDEEYNALRLSLKKDGSSVAMHDAPRCDAESGVCKMDMRVDKGKTRLLYLPGWARTRVQSRADSPPPRPPRPPLPLRRPGWTPPPGPGSILSPTLARGRAPRSVGARACAAPRGRPNPCAKSCAEPCAGRPPRAGLRSTATAWAGTHGHSLVPGHSRLQAGGLLVFSEVSFWTLHIDPLLSIILGVIPVRCTGGGGHRGVWTMGGRRGVTWECGMWVGGGRTLTLLTHSRLHSTPLHFTTAALY